MRLNHFDLIAHIYDRVFRYPGPDRLMGLLRAQASDLVLDVGGGTGRVSETFEDGYRVIICDPSWRMLKEARGKQMLVCAGLAERLPFMDGAFQGVVMVDAFHHLRDQQAAAGEVMRVVCPGGRSVIEEPDIRLWGVKLVALLERLLLMRSRFYSVADLRDLFESAGARVLALDEGHDSAVRLAVGRHENHREGAR
jgi:ubiquinone/menaquinone biosynthesis C-methylase UbiE